MGKSFVLKRPDGSLAGYLMQEREGMVCFRANALPEEGARLTLVLQNGTQVSRAVRGERETTWPERNGNIEAAFVSGDGRLLMSTGERGRQAYEAARERDEARQRAAERHARDAAMPLGKPADGQEKASSVATAEEPERTEPSLGEEKSAPPIAPSVPALPERRWPPPPCMPEARYEGGRWRT